MGQLSARTKERIFAATTITLSVLVAVSLCEIMSRVLAPPWLEQRMSILNPETGKGFGSDSNWKVIRRNGGFYSFESNSQFKVSHIEYSTLAHTDEFGGRQVPVPFTPGGNMLPMMGDSFVFGVGVEDNETFVSKIAARLPDYRVLNLGVEGTALTKHNEIIRLRHAELGRPRKYVLFFFIGNDFSDMIGSAGTASTAKSKPEPSSASADQIFYTINDFVYHNGVLRHSYLLQLVRKSVLELHNRLRVSEGATPNRDPVYLIMDTAMQSYATEAVAALKTQLGLLVGLEKELNFSAMIVAIPDRNQLDSSLRALMAQNYSIPAERLDPLRPNRLLAKLVHDAGLAFYDSTECLAATKLGQKLYYQRDNHFRPIGADRFAQCAFPEIAKFVAEAGEGHSAPSPPAR